MIEHGLKDRRPFHGRRCWLYEELCFVPLFLLYSVCSRLRGCSTILKKTPSISGHSYRCGEMIHTVNHLRRLGKDRSLAALRAYLAVDGEHDKVVVICRLLFVNPKGWETPVLGESVPCVNNKALAHFPLFPIGLANGMPFLLVEGYRRGGRAESALACVKLCEGFSLVKDDYPLIDLEKAARSLTQTDAFRQLYDEADMQRMSDMILCQAKQ
jgi:hypothetical protein